MKKAQIEMTENIIILFIFFILLIFAVVFFTRIQSTQSAQKIEEDIEGRALQIAQRVQFLPEIQCTKENVPTAANCYDEFSLGALTILAERGENLEYYFTLFGFSTITIKIIFPFTEDSFVIYDRPKEDFGFKTQSNVPVTICDFRTGSTKGICNFGVLTVDVYN